MSVWKENWNISRGWKKGAKYMKQIEKIEFLNKYGRLLPGTFSVVAERHSTEQSNYMGSECVQ